MKRFVLPALLVSVVLIAGQNITTGQQEADSPATPEPADAQDNNRLPPGYSEIITNSQKRSIYRIQQNYQGQIDQLRSQIEEIESKRDGEVAAILDDQQKQVLKFILQIREKNRAEAEAATEASDATAAVQ